MSPQPVIRRELRAGDLGEIIAHHGRLYRGEYNVDSTFEAHVAVSVGEAGRRGFPRNGEAIWIVELDGRHAGSIAVTDDGDGIATVRWVALDPELRGQGLGRVLVGEAVEAARRAGYRLLKLETFSELTAAARLYREHGVAVVSAEVGPRWGRDEITYQRYELDLQRRAHDLSSASAGSSSRPFSVRA